MQLETDTDGVLSISGDVIGARPFQHMDDPVIKG